MSHHAKVAGHRPARLDRRIEEATHDSYRERGKPAAPAHCPDCGARFREGRWQWANPEEAADSPSQPARCPACWRIADDFPAGYVTLAGPFLAAHETELRHLIDHAATVETRQHPLERLMGCERTAEGLCLTTTGVHLARRLGDALHDAYQGELEVNYNPQEARVRVQWRR